MSRRAGITLGLVIAVVIAGLMVLGVVGVGWGAVIGMIGVAVIAVSAARTESSEASE